jgi:hypothetical protein
MALNQMKNARRRGHLMNVVVHQMMNHLKMSEHRTMDVRLKMVGHQMICQLVVRHLFVDVNQTQMKQKLLRHLANQLEVVKA